MQAYSYIKTISVDRNFNSRWTHSVNPDRTLLSLINDCRDGYLILLNVVENSTVAYRFSSMQGTGTDLNQTIAEFLKSNDNAVLSTVTVPSINTRVVRYKHAIRAGYLAETVKLGYADDAVLSPSVKDGLKLTRPGIAYSEFAKYALLTVNGFFHQYDTNSQGIYVNGAMDSVRASDKNQIGIYSFKEVGAVARHSFTGSSIRPVAVDVPLSERMVIDIGYGSANKYAIFFIGGYMVPAGEGLITQIGETTWSFAFARFDWLSKFYEMARFLDISALGLLASPTNPTAYRKSDLLSNETIRKLMTMPQSFVALVDTPHFFIEREMLPITRLPGMYRAYGNVERLPLQIGHGRLAEYWTTTDGGSPDVYGVTVDDGYAYTRVFETSDVDADPVIDIKRVIGQRTRLSDAQFIRMGRDI